MIQLFNIDHKTYFTHLSKIISDLAKFRFLATGVYNTLTLAQYTPTSIGCTSHSLVMPNNSRNPLPTSQWTHRKYIILTSPKTAV